MLIRTALERRWCEPQQTTYADERSLETLIQESPEVIPGVPRGPVAVATQLGVLDVGPADIVVIDVEAGITIIECKLVQNPDIRRTVIGQVFSYAAGIEAMSFEQLDRAWSRRKGKRIIDDFNGPLPDELEPSGLVAKLASNLSQGRLRLVIAVDDMTSELKRTVTFINSHSGGTYGLLGLELKYVKHQDVEILLPTVYGEESASTKASQSSGGPLTDAYFEFWRELREWAGRERPQWMTGAQPYRDNWTEFRSPIDGTKIWLVFKRNRRLAVEVATFTADPTRNRQIYQELVARGQDLQQAIPDGIEWDPRPEKDWQRFRVLGPDAVITDIESRNAYQDWFINTTDRIWSVLSVSPAKRAAANGGSLPDDHSPAQPQPAVDHQH